MIVIITPELMVAQTNLSFTLISSFGNFENASGITLDPQNNIYISDKGTNKIYKYSNENKLISQTGGYGWDQYTFDQPVNIFTSFGLNIYVCDYGNHRIQRFDKSFNFISTYFTRNEGDEQKRFGYPLGAVVSSKGELFFIDGENKRIVKLNTFFNFEKCFGDISSGEARLLDPKLIKIDYDNNLYIYDFNRIAILDGFGNYLRSIKNGITDSLKNLFIGDSIYLLYKDKIIICDNKLNYQSTVDLGQIMELQDQNFVDVYVYKKSIYLLSLKKVFVLCFI